MYWVICKRDDAVLGCVSGIQSQATVDGPFKDEDKAYEVKSNCRRHGSYYYTVIESDNKPKDTEKEYEFADAAREFDDVFGY